MKSGCIDFLDFVNKLAARVTDDDQQIVRSNHVTWMLAQIIRIDLVMSTLSSDPKKVGFTTNLFVIISLQNFFISKCDTIDLF